MELTASEDPPPPPSPSPRAGGPLAPGPDSNREPVRDSDSDPGPGPGISGWLKALGVGALLSLPVGLPLAFLLRLWLLGWVIQCQKRALEQGGRGPLPSFRGPASHIKRGFRYSFQIFLLWFPGSKLMQMSWHAGWLASFGKFPSYQGFGPGNMLLGFLILAPVFAWMPLASVLVARDPESWILSRSRELRKLSLVGPLRYLGILALALLGFLPLQLVRARLYPGLGERFLVAFLGLAWILGQRLLWAHYLAWARPRLEEVDQRGWGWSLVHGLCLGVQGILGVLYAFAVVFCQFALWESDWAWFSHSLFLIPGVPAAGGAVVPYWEGSLP